MERQTVRIIHIGCKSNYYDAMCLEQVFYLAGFKVYPQTLPYEQCNSDVFVINSCTVTHNADRDSYKIARKLRSLWPKSCIVLTGCLAQINNTEKTTTGNATIDFFIGNTDKFRIPQIITNEGSLSKRWDTSIYKLKPALLFGRTRSFLKIQDGCNANCSFCIISQARGPERSLRINEVISIIKDFQNSGYLETNLTGIRVGRYGISNGESFFDLLKNIDACKDIKIRIRMGSLYPSEITCELMTLMSNSTKLCKHFHVSIQSLDDNILKLMNRAYSCSEVIEKIHKIKTILPDCFIGSDIIVGFPGETDRAFQNTYDRLKELPLSDIHVFPYSPRRGTKAINFSGQVDRHVIKERVKILKNLVKEKKTFFYNTQINKEHVIIPEVQHREQRSYLKGFSDNYVPIYVPYRKELENSNIKVKACVLESSNIIKGEVLNVQKS